MASPRKPCRYKACKGRVHRGPCPTAAKIGRKASRTTEAARKQQQNARSARRIENGVCGFCLTDCRGTQCTAAKAAQEASSATALKAAGRKMRAAAAAAEADRLKALALIQTVPTHPVQALGSMMLTCIKCHATKPAIQFNVAFAASDRFNLGDGLCCVDIDEVV